MALLTLSAALVGLLYLLSTPESAVASSPTPSSATAAPRIFGPVGCMPKTPCLAIVIDDMGRDQEPVQQLLDTELDLTFSILPHGAASKMVSNALRKAKREIWLHLPMAPRDRQLLTDEPVVLSPDGPMLAVVQDALMRVGPVEGVNNHMGSLFSEDFRAVNRLMTIIRSHSLLFLDSRTSARSLFCKGARQIGVPCVERDVFLDDHGDRATVDYRLEQAVILAKRRGWAVAIGHPIGRTIDALRRFRPGQRGVAIRRLSTFFGTGLDRAKY